MTTSDYEKAIESLDSKFLRDVANWPQAPVPVCMGGDYRGLTFCCKPGYSLTFGFKCMRDERLKEIGMTSDEFLEIKESFSEEHDWDGNSCCFGSLSYCCMRSGGCFRRDMDLAKRYPGKTRDEIMAEYFRLKRILSNIILKKAKNQDVVRALIEPDELQE